MSNAPHYEIDVAAFRADPYPDLAKMRRETPIAFVPQLGSTAKLAKPQITLTIAEDSPTPGGEANGV